MLLLIFTPQAYQGKDQVIYFELKEAHEVADNFIKRTLNESTEKLMFHVLGGDFNSDNMSQGKPQNQLMILSIIYQVSVNSLII